MSVSRLVVFDVDGTLIDSQHVILAAMSSAFAAAGHVMPEREVALGVVGLSLPRAMAELAPHLPEEETLRLAELYREGFVAQRAKGGAAVIPPLYPGARAALERLHGRPGTRMGIATGKARPGLVHLFETQDIGHFFVTTQTADAHPSKPHPSMLLSALSETGSAASEAVMIGDTEFDIAMGRAAGFSTIGVAWGYHPRARLEAAGADLVIEHFDALDAALDQLAGGAS